MASQRPAARAGRSTFLAAKVEEHPKRLRDVLLVFYHMYRKVRGSFFYHRDSQGSWLTRSTGHHAG
jgi:hypothetical protein